MPPAARPATPSVVRPAVRAGARARASAAVPEAASVHAAESMAATPHGCTCAKLRRLTRRLTAVYDRELAAVGLRVTQYSLLAQLRGVAGPGGVALTELAERMDMDRTTLTRNLRPLIDHGWAELVPSAADARVRLARVTAAGNALYAQARPHWKRAQDEVNQTLGAARVMALHQQLDAATPMFRPVEQASEE